MTGSVLEKIVMGVKLGGSRHGGVTAV